MTSSNGYTYGAWLINGTPMMPSPPTPFLAPALEAARKPRRHLRLVPQLPPQPDPVPLPPPDPQPVPPTPV